MTKDWKGILVFISYATSDSNKFQISIIAEKLTSYTEIEDVLYWEEDMDDNIYAYMDENVGKCDIFILFCSKNALKSEPVTLEWRSALKIKKKLFPFLKMNNTFPRYYQRNWE